MNNNVQVIEKKIIDAVMKNIDSVVDPITPATNFNQLELDSLKLMLIMSDLEKSLELSSEVNLDHNIIFTHATVKSLAKYISSLEQ